MINIPEKITDISNKIEDELDFDFRATNYYINSIDDFNEQILEPYYKNERIFYRGESKISEARPLLPSIFRDRNMLVDDELIKIVGCDELIDFYNKYPKYVRFYNETIRNIENEDLYTFLSFSQHYLGISPFLDFTKSPFVSLSFALKNRKEYSENILFYTVEIKNEQDYTNKKDVANDWLKNYTVIVLSELNKKGQDAFKFRLDKYRDVHNEVKGKSFIDLTAPTARLIDVPTNDLMKYQQGVFLLLNDFTLVSNGYLTKKIRDEFVVKKFIVNKDICPDLLKMLNTEHPYYNYENITDLTKLVKSTKQDFNEQSK